MKKLLSLLLVLALGFCLAGCGKKEDDKEDEKDEISQFMKRTGIQFEIDKMRNELANLETQNAKLREQCNEEHRYYSEARRENERLMIELHEREAMNKVLTRDMDNYSHMSVVHYEFKRTMAQELQNMGFTEMKIAEIMHLDVEQVYKLLEE